MMTSGEKKEKEFRGSSLIKKLKTLNIANQMLKLNGFMTENSMLLQTVLIDI